jgi:iron-sulfur cluster assembly accessory protein
MLNLTHKAKEYLKKITAEHSKQYVYLSVEGGGCSGFQYKWDLTNDTDKGTLIEDILVLDELAEMFVLGSSVDYISELGGSYLKVINPNATAQCGCGESFGV